METIELPYAFNTNGTMTLVNGIEPMATKTGNLTQKA